MSPLWLQCSSPQSLQKTRMRNVRAKNRASSTGVLLSSSSRDVAMNYHGQLFFVGKTEICILLVSKNRKIPKHSENTNNKYRDFLFKQDLCLFGKSCVFFQTAMERIFAEHSSNPGKLAWRSRLVVVFWADIFM